MGLQDNNKKSSFMRNLAVLFLSVSSAFVSVYLFYLTSEYRPKRFVVFYSDFETYFSMYGLSVLAHSVVIFICLRSLISKFVKVTSK